MRKKYKIYHLVLLALLLRSVFSGNVFAETIPTKQDPDYMSFQKYLDGAKQNCDGDKHNWSDQNSAYPIPQYPELSAEAVNLQIERTKNLDNISEDEKKRLEQDLDAVRIGSLSWFKTLEVARLQYRSSMDALFSCGIIDSRLRILADLREQIDAKMGSLNSEIKNQLDKEQQRLEREKDNLRCNNAWADKATVLHELVNSATRQYCHYRYYLSYLEDNLKTNRANLEAIEKNIGTGNGTKIATNTELWIESYNNYTNSLTREIDRADNSLPRALRTFLDMERAYPAHLMLTIIYDDYIRLRANLSKYMNASTQTYLKANNAQDANNR